MVNLLPRSEKQKIRYEYWLRIGIAFLGLILGFEVLTAFLFSPAYYALYINTRDLSQSLEEKRALLPPGSDEAAQTLAAIGQDVATLAIPATNANVEVSTLVSELLAKRTNGIEISSLSYGRNGGKVSIQILGEAETQEDILAFRREITKDPRVAEFKYDSNFITQKTDIPFSANVTYKEN